MGKNSFIISLLLLSVFNVAFSVKQQNLSALFSYGYGDSADNAKKRYLNLLPRGFSNMMLYCPTFTKDSLISSIFDVESYTDDLHNARVSGIQQKEFLGVAHSRGAEMLIHYVGQHNPAKIKAVVLVGCPVSVGQAVKNKSYLAPSIPKKMLKSINKIQNKSLPIIFLYQKQDVLVVPAHTHLLSQAFKEAGFKNIYVVEMSSGGHNYLIDAYGYKVLQSFYKKFDLFLDNDFETLSDSELSCYQI